MPIVDWAARATATATLYFQKRKSIPFLFFEELQLQLPVQRLAFWKRCGCNASALTELISRLTICVVVSIQLSPMNEVRVSLPCGVMTFLELPWASE